MVMDDSSKIFAGSSSTKRIKETYLASVDFSNISEMTLGKNTTKILLTDPKLLGFMLARHKFVSKMLTGRRKVLEIGCQEGFDSMVVAQTVDELHSIDFYLNHIRSCQRRLEPLLDNVKFYGADILDGPILDDFDAVFALDVLEHIEKTSEDQFMRNVIESMTAKGTLILGMPSLESQVYASAASKIGHVNCKNGDELSKFCKKHYDNVFCFGMNDETLHTGFASMSHYLFAVCVSPRVQS